MTEAFFVFVASFILALGPRLLIGSITDIASVIGALLASLAFTFFWTLRKNRP